MTSEIYASIVSLRHTLHAHPELSMHEEWTKNTLMSFLRDNTSLEITDCGRWFYAYYKSSNKAACTIAFRSDFDAVAIKETCDIPYISQFPGVGHKCGHDGHSSALCGFALEINEKGADNNIYFIFQHAEEIGMGGAECAKLIKEKNIDRVYAIHNMSGYPEGSIVCRNGLSQCASTGLTISYTGKPSHASQPEDGINPAYAIASLINLCKELVRPGNFEDMVLCTIIHCEIGQKNFGISAGNGELSLTLRANREDDLNELKKRICDSAASLASEYGMQVTFALDDPFPETRNADAAISSIRNAATALNLKLIDMPAPWRASEDFGYYTKECCGAIFYVGNGEDYPPVHTGNYDFNDKILPVVADMYMVLANEHLK